MPNFLKKIQDLPEERKKIILWSIVAVLALILLSWWYKNFKAKIDALQLQSSNPEVISMEREVKSLSSIDQ
ncbi:MAG: hypothetical protein NTZ84_01865 [Candidatus Nealsonbacteria bacterium]|nr:hypothetical protein [Candidatus Nealsonbacteria bacterium]